jgi:hypothetical protein
VRLAVSEPFNISGRCVSTINSTINSRPAWASKASSGGTLSGFVLQRQVDLPRQPV